MLLEARSLMPPLLLLPKLASRLADVHIKPKSKYHSLIFVSISTLHLIMLAVSPSHRRMVSSLTAIMR
jgi:hypothetical protein